MRAAALAGAGLLLLLGINGPAGAQVLCAPAASADTGQPGLLVAVPIGAVRFEVAGDRQSEGVEVGVEGSAGSSRMAIRGGVHRVLLAGAAADPTLVRIRASARLLEVAGLAICGTGLGGGSVVSAGDDRATSVAGGVGMRVGAGFPAGAPSLFPFAGIRVLGAWTGGEILDRTFDGVGGSLGAEGGIGAKLGDAEALLHVTHDGFDPGLGATAYPALALRFSVGWRF